MIWLLLLVLLQDGHERGPTGVEMSSWGYSVPEPVGTHGQETQAAAGKDTQARGRSQSQEQNPAPQAEAQGKARQLD